MSSANEDHVQMFARIRLHGLTKTSKGTPCPIDLYRKISFPIPADGCNIRADHHDKDLSARSLAPKYDIEARVRFEHRVSQQVIDDGEDYGDDGGVYDDDDEGWPSERERQPDYRSNHSLGAGRAGTVYPLEIISIKPFSVSDSSSSSEDPMALPTLPPLCVKVATPGYARSLAREAWFYEQFDIRNLTRFVTPRCYGVFHASNLPDEVTIDIPGYDYHSIASIPLHDGIPLYTAMLPEELYDNEQNTIVSDPEYFMDDSKKSYSNSEWRLFRETPEVTTMTVLVMDLLGPSLTHEEFEEDWNHDLNDIWDHLMPHDIIHKDIRFPNILRVPPHLRVPCPIHPNAGAGHRWALTDWEGAKIYCVGLTKTPLNIWQQRKNLLHYYFSHGGRQDIKYPPWEDCFDVVKQTRELIYIGTTPGRKRRKPNKK